MKILFNLIFVAICVTFSSCQKDENLSANNSSITSDGLLKGKIVNYIPNSIDSLNAIIYYIAGTGKVSTTGNFSISLIVPMLEMINVKKGLTVSDTNAMVGLGSVVFCSYLNNSYTGVLKKCNYTDDSAGITGMAYSYFVYSDRTFTIKGTYVNTYLYKNTINTTQSYDFNVTLNKGWNELVRKLISCTSTVNSTTELISVTNNITPDLQWHYLKQERFLFIHGELPGKD